MGIALILMQILAVLPNLIQAAEQVLPTAGNGAAKAAAVLTAVTPMIPDELAPKVIPQVKAYISMFVSMFNMIHPLFAKAPPATQPVYPQAQPAAVVQPVTQSGIVPMPSFGG